jgi:hypothetical protein
MGRIDVASRGSGVTANTMARTHMAVRIPNAVARASAVTAPSGMVPETTNRGDGRSCL